MQFYLEGKQVAQQVNEPFLLSCVHEMEDWTAEKIEKWVNLAQGLSVLKNAAAIDISHLLLSLSLTDKDKVSNKARKNLLFTHFLQGTAVQDLALFKDALLEEIELLSTAQFQSMMEIALDSMRQRKRTVLARNDLFTASILVNPEQPLNHYKRQLLVHYFLYGKLKTRIPAGFVNQFALQLPKASTQTIKDIVMCAQDLAQTRGSDALEPQDFYVALCLSQKNERVACKAYRTALVKYYLKNKLKHSCTESFLENLIDLIKDLTVSAIEVAIKAAEDWARKRAQAVIQPIDFYIALYDTAFDIVHNKLSIRKDILQHFLGKARGSAQCMEKVLSDIEELSLVRIVALVNHAKELAGKAEIQDRELYLATVFELQQDERSSPYNLDAGVRDQYPYGDSSKQPNLQQRTALLHYYLKDKSHAIRPALLAYIASGVGRVSRCGVERIVEKAYVFASEVQGKQKNEILIRECDIMRATRDLYPHCDFLDWYVRYTWFV